MFDSTLFKKAANYFRASFPNVTPEAVVSFLYVAGKDRPTAGDVARALGLSEPEAYRHLSLLSEGRGVGLLHFTNMGDGRNAVGLTEAGKAAVKGLEGAFEDSPFGDEDAVDDPDDGAAAPRQAAEGGPEAPPEPASPEPASPEPASPESPPEPHAAPDPEPAPAPSYDRPHETDAAPVSSFDEQPPGPESSGDREFPHDPPPNDPQSPVQPAIGGGQGAFGHDDGDYDDPFN
ncbi:hypothetical protein [Yunchengibacter salinarum]|uniref:hypothetical protein n=1 Tax=Yunchengibacter salinarum TaxID=3133399 RepID=UPI0035B68573